MGTTAEATTEVEEKEKTDEEKMMDYSIPSKELAEFAQGDRLNMAPAHETALVLTGNGVRCYDQLREFVENTLVEGIHYGKVGGWNTPQLYQGGAQLLAAEAGLAASFEEVERTVDHENKFYAFEFRCILFRRDTGEKWSEGQAAAVSTENSMNQKDPGFLYHCTLAKAGKRAYVAAVIKALALSGIFTYGLEDLRGDPEFDKPAAHKYYFGNTIKDLFVDEEARHSKQKEITGKASEQDFLKEDYTRMRTWADAERKRRGRQKNGSRGNKQPQPEPAIVDSALESVKEMWETLAKTLKIKTPEVKYYLGEILLVNMDNPGSEGMERVHDWMKNCLPKVDIEKIKASVAKSIAWRGDKNVTERAALELIRELASLPGDVLNMFMGAMGVEAGVMIRDIPPVAFPGWRSALVKAKHECDYEDPPEDNPDIVY